MGPREDGAVAGGGDADAGEVHYAPGVPNPQGLSSALPPASSPSSGVLGGRLASAQYSFQSLVR